MELAPLRFTKIEGTSVSVDAETAEEAKVALKELRHKRRELKFLRGALVRQQKAIRSKEKRAKRPKSFFSKLVGGARWLFNALMDRALVARADRRPRSAAEIQRELQRIDQILHNLQGCIIQIEGKLLAS